MAAKLSLFSLVNHQHHPECYYYKRNNQAVVPAARASSLTSWMWMWNPSQEDDDSWEVRAFAQDTGNILGATWPPRSYTCTFCRREFRSAQALGGHMNVHRRDRARLHHHHHQSTLTQPLPPSSSSSSPSSSTTLIIPTTQEFPTINNGGGFCLLYHRQLPHHHHHPSHISNNVNAIFNPTRMNACVDSTSSTLVSISPHNSSNNARVFACAQSVNAPPLQLQSQQTDSSYRRTVVVGSSSYGGNSGCKESEMEEIDLELRL